MNLQPLGIVDFVTRATNTRKNHKNHKNTFKTTNTNPQPSQLPNSHAKYPFFRTHGILYLPIADHPSLLP